MTQSNQIRVQRNVISLRPRYRPAFADPFADARAARTRALARTRVGATDDSATATSSASASSGSSASTTQLVTYVALPALAGALVGGLAWGLLPAVLLSAVGAGGGYAALTITQASATPPNLCLANLPEPAKSQAQAAIDKNDAAQLDSLATQADAKGWHCAATELRSHVPANRTIAWVPGCSPPAGWIAPAGAALGATPPAGMFSGWTPPDGWKLGTALPSGVCPTGWTSTLSGLEGKPVEKGGGLGGLGGGGVVAGKGPSPIKAPADVLAKLPDDVKAAVQAAYDSGDPQQLDDVAAAQLVGYPDAWKKVKDDAAVIRAKWSTPLSSLPMGLGTDYGAVADETGASWMSTPQSTWTSTVPWGDAQTVANAFYKRQYKQAAHDIGTLYLAAGKAVGSDGGIANIDALWPLT